MREDGPPLPQQEVNEVVAPSSSESVSSSDSSSSSSKASKTKTGSKQAEFNTADEVVEALHRSTWHVKMSQSWRGQSEIVHTACGRHFDLAQLMAVEELQLTGRQSLCGHPGCRKGWSAAGAL